MKRKIPLPVLIAVGLMVIGGLFGLGNRTLGNKHKSSEPPMSIEQIKARNAATYSGRQ
jgi:hypothetical protein